MVGAGRGDARPGKVASMLWTLIAILLVLWLLGLLTNVGGALIHALLIVALVVFIVQQLVGRRRVI
jgi:hypothetical protein